MVQTSCPAGHVDTGQLIEIIHYYIQGKVNKKCS